MTKKILTQNFFDRDRDEPAAIAQLRAKFKFDLRTSVTNLSDIEGENHQLKSRTFSSQRCLEHSNVYNIKQSFRLHGAEFSAKIIRLLLISNALQLVNKLKHSEFNIGIIPTKEKAEELIRLDEALKNLASFDDVKKRIFELVYFGGLTNEQVAELLDVSVSDVSVSWRLARAWLAREIRNF